jgi:hypothetical protein
MVSPAAPNRYFEMRRVIITPAVVAGQIEDLSCANAHDGHVDMLLIQARCHSTAALGGKNVTSKHLNNRAIFACIETLHLNLQ